MTFARGLLNEETIPLVRNFSNRSDVSHESVRGVLRCAEFFFAMVYP